MSVSFRSRSDIGKVKQVWRQRDVDDAGLRDGGPTGHRDGRAGQFGSRYGGPVLPRRMRTGGGS